MFQGASMPSPILYKYRSLDNWKFVLDIIVNKRMYASPFHALNDPMEGRYYYFGEAVTRGFRRAIYQSKTRRNILSLSQTKTNTLLWSYYAAGHKGVAFGVRLTNVGRSDVEMRPVTYDSGVHIGPEAARRNPDLVALDILTQKQLPWAHEREVRAFSPDTFIPVTLSELVLGCMIEPADEALISTVARRWHPRLRISKVDRSTLDEPDAV